jgi:hypothetical protein
MAMDPTDGRSYVSLGKVMLMQRRFDEARKLYEDGAAVTGPRLTRLIKLQPASQLNLVVAGRSRLRLITYSSWAQVARTPTSGQRGPT